MHFKKIFFGFLLTILTTQEFYASFLIPERERILMKQGFSRIQAQDLIYAVDTNQQDDQGNTALHKTFLKHPTNVELIKNLIDVGANVNAQNSNGDTILHMAIRNYNTNKTEENLEMVKFLLDLNLTDADIDIFNNNQESPRTLNAELIHNIVAEQNAVKHDEAVRAYSESQRLKNLKMEEDYAF